MGKPTLHRLKRTDTLEALSASYRVPVCMIMRANALGTDCSLSQLRTLKIPPRCYCIRCRESGAAPQTYVVQPDDTLYDIAHRFGLTMRILQRANGLEDPECIRPGDALLVPRLSGKVRSVREGESLADIARGCGVPAARLRQANRMGPSEEVFPGLRLLIPDV
jgi:spore germination protein